MKDGPEKNWVGGGEEEELLNTPPDSATYRCFSVQAEAILVLNAGSLSGSKRLNLGIINCKFHFCLGLDSSRQLGVLN